MSRSLGASFVSTIIPFAMISATSVALVAGNFDRCVCDNDYQRILVLFPFAN